MLVENSILPIQNFSLIRGRSMAAQTWCFVDWQTGAPLDITGFLFQMDVVGCDGAVAATYSVGNGFSIPAGVDGQLVMTKLADEKNIPAGKYALELKVTAPNGFVGTWWRGQYNSVESITE